MTQVASRYRNVNQRKAGGEHYTPNNLAKFVAEQIVTVLDRPKNQVVRILDPAAGDGELLQSLIRQLQFDGYRELEVWGFDTDTSALSLAKTRLGNEFPDICLKLLNEDFLQFAVDHFEQKNPDGQSGLFIKELADPFHVVIANPPYVRTQVMGAIKSKRLAIRFGLKGRVDLYHAFLQAISLVLVPSGVVGIIVSNRFMTTKSGDQVRKDIRRQFEIEHVWDLGDTKLFEAAVLPAVLLLKLKNDQHEVGGERFTSIYSCPQAEQMPKFATIIDAIRANGVVTVNDGRSFRVLQGSLAAQTKPSDVWRVSTVGNESWLKTVAENTWGTFSDIGKLRVGVKTTADNVFIRKDWTSVCHGDRPELLRPLITHFVARRFRAAENGGDEKQILYPHENRNGKRCAVQLDKYPVSRRYLESNRRALASRKYVSNAGRNWFELWVPHDPDSWQMPKLVWRDICENPVFWIDKTGSVVNGDCYWMNCEDQRNEELLWLAAAVGNSTFIERFYDTRFNNRLYSSRRRFITQYVREFPLPDPTSTVAKDLIDLTRQIYDDVGSKDTSDQELQSNALVWQAFGLVREEV